MLLSFVSKTLIERETLLGFWNPCKKKADLQVTKLRVIFIFIKNRKVVYGMEGVFTESAIVTRCFSLFRVDIKYFQKFIRIRCMGKKRITIDY